MIHCAAYRNGITPSIRPHRGIINRDCARQRLARCYHRKMNDFEFKSEIEAASTDQLRDILLRIAEARQVWWDAECDSESDSAYIDAVGAALFQLETK